jgi:hypothetical protein
MSGKEQSHTATSLSMISNGSPFLCLFGDIIRAGEYSSVFVSHDFFLGLNVILIPPYVMLGRGNSLSYRERRGFPLSLSLREREVSPVQGNN